MSLKKRTPTKLPHPGPFIARITSHLDPTFMGGVEAVLEQGTLNNPEWQDYVFPLQYLSPFYGVTSSDFEGADEKNFYDVQKSYGMWMVPPDVGTRVLCTFVDGDANQGYWIGCIADRHQNHMIPGIAASAKVAWAPGQKEKYDVDAVPVAEFHRKKIKGAYEPNSQLKPVHPFADRLLAQGLLADAARGVTSSSARREFPSRVFGISTPGAPDGKSPVKPIGYKDPGQTMVPTSRLPGHQFVMDDGDKLGENKLIRLRSGGGHQILLNDSQNIIYIANAEGTAWMEFTANGKIDIYAKDSVSIHTEQDFNFRAGRDINLEAIRDVNVKTHTGNMIFNVEKDFNLKVDNEAKIYINGQYDQYIKGNYNTTVNKTINFLSNEKMNLTGKQDLSVITQGKFTIAAAGGTKHGKPGDIAEPATAAIRDTTTLKTRFVPKVTKGVGWPKRKYQDDPTVSILQRVPMHEPWSQHESLSPTKYSPPSTDIKNPSAPASSSAPATGASSTTPSANPPKPPPNPNMPADWAKDTGFINKVKEVAKKYKMDYIDLLAIMQMESGMDPSKPNPNSGASGLIQFTKVVLPDIGNPTFAQLRAMTREQQMHYVDLYLSKSTPGLANLSSVPLNDVYMAVFAPNRGFGKPDDTILYSDNPAWLAKFSDVRKPGASLSPREFEALAYTQNAALDKNGDRAITKADASRLLLSKRAQVVKALGL